MTVDIIYLMAAIGFFLGAWLTGYVTGIAIWAVKRLLDGL